MSDYKIYKVNKEPDDRLKFIKKDLPAPCFRISVIGPTGVGKTQFIYNMIFNDLWGYINYFDNIILCIGSDDDYEVYKHFAEIKNFYLWNEKKKEYYKTKKLKLIEKVIMFREADEETLKELYDILEEKTDESHLIVFDDMITDELFTGNRSKKNIIDTIFVKGRHCGKGLSVIISTQDYIGLNRNIRNKNSSSLILFNGLENVDLEKIAIENGLSKDFPYKFQNVLCPKSYDFLVLNQKKRGDLVKRPLNSWKLQDKNFLYINDINDKDTPAT